jgi:maltooligosyltrehalose trehalohydrolase
MLFMGQEWAASTPFQFFTDHNAELGKAITEGRRNEFKDFAAFRDSDLLEMIPNPQAADTFLRSKLRWDELAEAPHAGTFFLYRDFLRLRRTHLFGRSRSRDDYTVIELADGILALLLGRAGEFDCAVLADLTGGHAPPNLDDARLAPGGGRDWRLLLTSNEMRFGGVGTEPFSVPTTIVYEAV